MSIPVRSEYTPEKVAELARRLRGDIFDAVPDDGDLQSVLDLAAEAADALTAVSADRDRLRKAITEAREYVVEVREGDRWEWTEWEDIDVARELFPDQAFREVKRRPPGRSVPVEQEGTS